MFRVSCRASGATHPWVAITPTSRELRGRAGLSQGRVGALLAASPAAAGWGRRRHRLPSASISRTSRRRRCGNTEIRRATATTDTTSTRPAATLTTQSRSGLLPRLASATAALPAVAQPPQLRALAFAIGCFTDQNMRTSAYGACMGLFRGRSLQHRLPTTARERGLCPRRSADELRAAHCAARDLLKADPLRSDRAIAAECGLEHKAIGRLRRELERMGEVPAYRRAGRGLPWRAAPLSANAADPIASRVSDAYRDNEPWPVFEDVRVLMRIEYTSDLPAGSLGYGEMQRWGYERTVVLRVATSFARDVLDDGEGLRRLVSDTAARTFSRLQESGWPIQRPPSHVGPYKIRL